MTATRSNHRRRGSLIVLALLAHGQSGCAPVPELAVTPGVVSSAWQEATPGGKTPLEAAWTAFGSRALEGLIAQARISNSDIVVARARVTQARGQLGMARAASLPTVDVAAAADTSSRTDGNNRRISANSQSFGVDIAYDVDLFGSASAGTRSARARLAASAFDRDAIALAVESDVARAFIQYAALSTRISILGRALANARELDRIIGVRVREGIATRVDSGLQAIEVRRIEAEISRIIEARSRTRNALAILVGAEPPEFTLDAVTLDDFTPPTFGALQPGALLSRRPDVKAAEASIAAANGDVDRARAAFLPRLRLSAGSLLEAGSGGPLGAALSAGAGVLAPIFEGGRLRGNLLTAAATQREVVETYRKALLVALGETEDALAGLEQSGRRGSLLAETMTVAQTTARLARRQYVEGAADLQIVLDAERNALDVEDAYAVATQDRLNSAIDLYRALGGAPSAAVH